MLGLLIKVGFAMFVGILLIWVIGEFLSTKLGRFAHEKLKNKLDELGWKEDK